MGKNYTLYINQDQFAEESNKSGLINKLLKEYYEKQTKLPEPTIELINDEETI